MNLIEALEVATDALSRSQGPDFDSMYYAVSDWTEALLELREHLAELKEVTPAKEFIVKSITRDDVEATGDLRDMMAGILSDDQMQAIANKMYESMMNGEGGDSLSNAVREVLPVELGFLDDSNPDNWNHLPDFDNMGDQA